MTLAELYAFRERAEAAFLAAVRAEFEAVQKKWGVDGAEPAALETLERLFSGAIPLTVDVETKDG
jgi:hypothetical protein